jgi:hypothetical protein
VKVTSILTVDIVNRCKGTFKRTWPAISKAQAVQARETNRYLIHCREAGGRGDRLCAAIEELTAALAALH